MLLFKTIKRGNSVDGLLDKKVTTEKDEHDLKMEKMYADAEEFLDKEYSEPLKDDEIILLHVLFERAKRDERFKDSLKDIRLTDIKYESIFAMFRMMDK